MPGLFGSVRIGNLLGLLLFLVLWIVLYECTHVLVSLVRREPVIGWGIGPLGITLMTLRRPSLFFIWLDVFCPAIVSGVVLWFSLFSAFSPLSFSERWLLKLCMLIAGVCLTSVSDLSQAVRDMRYPLWGEARVLRTIQLLRNSCAHIHFTSFGQSYLRKQFDINPSEILQALSL